MKLDLRTYILSVAIFVFCVPEARSAEITIYRASYGSGGFVGLTYFVDGKPFTTLKNAQKSTIQLPPGPHTFRLRAVDSTWTFTVTGSHVIRQGGSGYPPYWTEALVEKDPELKKEYEEAETVVPSNPAPLGQ